MATTKKNQPFADFNLPFADLDQLGVFMGPWSDQLRTLGESQTRTAQQMTGQMVDYSKQLNNQVLAQLHSSAKLAKDGIDYGVSMLDAWRKIWVESAEATLENLNANR